MDLDITDLIRIRNSKVLNANGIRNVKFTGVSIDSRKCKKDNLFFAIKGERFDGHDFVEGIFKSGCKCAVVSKKWFNGLDSSHKGSFKNKTIVLVSDTVKALGELAALYRAKFLIPVIAVGGSNGKTSAKDFIAHVLSKKYRVLKTEGNLNNELGLPLTLFNLRRKHEMAVVEVGMNHFKEIENLCKICKPQFGLVTNIGREHLEFLKNIQGAAKAEGELVEYLKQTFGTFFLNADDKYLRKMADRNKVKVFSYSSKTQAEVRGKVTRFKGFYPDIEIKHMSSKINTTLNNIGYQSFLAALSAAAVGFYFEVPAVQIKKAITEYKIESGKRNQLKNSGGVWIIDDTYNSNPDSVLAAFENLKAYKTKGKKHVVLGDMLELGKSSKSEHRSIGREAAKMKFENLYTYGNDSYQTYLGAKGVKNNYHFSDKGTLSELLALSVKKNDVVLIKGSRGMKMEDVVEYLNKN